MLCKSGVSAQECRGQLDRLVLHRLVLHSHTVPLYFSPLGPVYSSDSHLTDTLRFFSSITPKVLKDRSGVSAQECRGQFDCLVLHARTVPLHFSPLGPVYSSKYGGP
jgi:hypothetical protein